MRRLAALIAALSLVTAAGSTTAGAGSAPPPFPRLPGTWSHAEINVTIRRVPHTLILDRGKIVRASATQLVLRERDGSRVTIPLSQQQTLVVVNGLAATVFDLRRGMSAQTMRIDGGVAVRVRAASV
jgi:hypothetical protein